MRGRPSTPIAERLAQKLERQPNGCLEWRGAKIRGYGMIREDSTVGHRTRRVTRVIWESEYGPIPKSLIVRHKCDNPPCCDIDHLELGTHKDNAFDRDTRGRIKREALSA